MTSRAGNGGDDPGTGAESPTPGPAVDVPVAIDLPIRIISPGDDEGSGGGELPAEDEDEGSDGPENDGGSGADGGALGDTAGSAACPDLQAMSLGGGGTPAFAAKSLLLLALLALGFAVLQAAGRVPLGRWLR